MIQSRRLKARLILLLGLLPCLLLGFESAGCGASNEPTQTLPGCARQQAACEAACQPRELPGSSEKEPFTRSDMEADRCREQCRAPGCSGS
jgi:hypothetical protein